MANATLDQAAWRLIPLRSVEDSRGTLVVGEVAKELPFTVKRFFTITDVGEGHKRGVHAHRELEEVLIPLSGAFTAHLSTPTRKESFLMNDQSVALYIPAGVWLELTDFQPQTICLALASDVYNEKTYCRSWSEYENFLNNLRST